MFKTVSMTGTGILTVLLSYVLSYLGVNAGTSEIADWVNSIINVLGLCWIIIGQIRRSDLDFGIFRK
jgi:uncharacterized membrane protein